MKYLFVLAHPDDEVDVGGTIYRLRSKGHEVAVAILVGKVKARRNLSDTLSIDERDSMRTLNVCKVYHADYPNIKMNTVPCSEIVKSIEEFIVDWQAEAIITHFTSDLNIDHAVTGKATIAATRSCLRSDKAPKLRLVMMCETAGATEWVLDSSRNKYMPNCYVSIGKQGLEVKLKAHACYKGVPRRFPHPYSSEAYTSLAVVRGAQCGCEYAEAFQCVYRSE